MSNYLIISNDLITIDEYIKEIIKANKLEEANLIKYDMNETLLESVMEELNTYGLFSENKVVVLYSCFFLSRDKKRGELEQNEELLIDYINNPNELNTLILVTDSIDDRKKINKLLKEKLTVYDKSISIEDKIRNSKEDFQIDDRTIRYFINLYNKDNERIINEFEKLKLYKYKEKIISIEDIDRISVKDLNDDIFSLINSITKKDSNHALEIYKELINRGEELTKIVIMVCDQFRLIYKVKLLLKEKKNIDTITNMLGIHPYRVKLASELSNTFTFEQLEGYLKELGKIDIYTKLGLSNNDFGFEIFLLGI